MNKLDSLLLKKDFLNEDIDEQKLTEFNELRIDSIKYIYEMLAKRIDFLKMKIKLFTEAHDQKRIELLYEIDIIGNIDIKIDEVLKLKPRDFFANIFKNYIEVRYLQELVNLQKTITNFLDNSNESDLLEMLHFLSKTKCLIIEYRTKFNKSKNNKICDYEDEIKKYNKQTKKKHKTKSIIYSNVNEPQPKEIQELNKKITIIKASTWFGEEDYKIINDIEELLGLKENDNDPRITNLEKSYYEFNIWNTDWHKDLLGCTNYYSKTYLVKVQKTMLFASSLIKLRIDFSNDMLNQVDLPENLKKILTEENDMISAKGDLINEALNSKAKSRSIPNLATTSKNDAESVVTSEIEENNDYLNSRFVNFRNQYYLMRCFDEYNDEGISIIKEVRNIFIRNLESKKLYGQLQNSASTATVSTKPIVTNKQLDLHDNKEQSMINIIEEIHNAQEQEDILNQKIESLKLQENVINSDEDSLDKKKELEKNVVNLAEQHQQSKAKLSQFVQKQEKEIVKERIRNEAIAKNKIRVLQEFKLISDINQKNANNFYINKAHFDKNTIEVLNDLFTNGANIRFTQFESLMKRLGGEIITSGGGGSHHKVEFKNGDKTYSFSVVKRMIIENINLKIVLRRLSEILPENWQNLANTQSNDNKYNLSMSA